MKACWRVFLVVLSISMMLIAGCGDKSTKPENRAPAANAGADQTVTLGVTVNLEGSGTDQDPSDVLTYAWALVVRPAGSAAVLTNANQAAASFVPDLVGSYTARLTVSDGRDPRTDDVVITVNAAPPQPQIIDADIESNRTLANLFADPTAVDYIVTASIHIGAALTIEPGVRIRFEAATGFTVLQTGGSIHAVGTSALPIVMEGTTATPGFWWGLDIRSNSTANELSYVDLAHSGFHETIGGVNVAETGAVKMTHCTIHHAGHYGLVAGLGAELREFAANTFSSNEAAPVYIPAQLIGSLDKASHYAGGNTPDYVEVFATAVTRDQTWPKLDAPYHIHLQPEIQARVVIEAGAHFLFYDAGGIDVSEGGALKAVGTATDSITFRGDAGTPGQLDGIWFDTANAENELTYCDIAHGGYNGNPNIMVHLGARLKMTHSSSRWGTNTGFQADEPADISGFSSNTFAHNEGPAISVTSAAIGSLDSASHYAGENGKEYIEVVGTHVPGSQTWRAMDAPYFITENSTALIDGAVTVQPGAHFLFDGGGAIEVAESGSLHAVGTLEHPITFLGAEETPGHWFGISVHSASLLNELTYTEVAHGGQAGWANVYIFDAAAMKVTHSSIHDSEGCGVAWWAESSYIASDNSFGNNAGGDECALGARR